MKGIATWIMVIGSVLLGISLFFVGVFLVTRQAQVVQKQEVIAEISSLYSKMKTTCISGGIGQVYYYNIGIPEVVKTVYVTDEEYKLPPDKVSVLITNRDYATGNFLCFQFFDENLPRCWPIDCQTNFTYIGTPSLKNDLASLIARLTEGPTVYRYRVLINKTEARWLSVSSNQIIAPEIFREKTTTTLPQETTTSTTVPQYTFTMLYIQLNEPIANFEMMAEGAKNLFVQITPLSNCPNRVRSVAVTDRICNIPDQNRLCNGDTSVIPETINEMHGCANSWGYGGDYNRIIGVVSGDFVCGEFRGYTQIYSSAVVTAGGSLTRTSTHEIGHTFGLCDEGYGNALCDNCPGGPGAICSYSGTACYSPTNDCSDGYLCPNKPEQNSLMCTSNLCNRPCTYAQRFASTSYAHLERELNRYC